MLLYHDKIRPLREKTGLQTKIFCERVGISVSTLWHWEKGTKTPPEKKVRKLAKILGVPVEDISDLTSEFKKSTHNLSEVINVWGDSTGLYTKDTILDFEDIIKKLKAQQKNLIQQTMITKTVMSSLNSLIYIKDVNQRYLLANKAFLETLSLKPDYKIEGKTDNDLYSINEANEISKQDKKVLMTGKAIVNYNSFMPGTKRKRYALISKHPIFDSDNRIAGLIGTYNDITEMRKAGRTREILEIYVGAMTDCLSVFFSDNYKYIYVNDAYAEVFGYPVEKFYEGGLIDFFAKTCVHPDDMANEEKYLREKEWPKSRKFRIIKPTGEIRWLEGSVNKRTYLGKECCISVNRDVTDRVQKAAFSDLLELMLNRSNDVLWIKEQGKPRKTVYISDSIEKLFGFNAKEFYTDPDLWINCIFPADLSIVKEEGEGNIEVLSYRVETKTKDLISVEQTSFELMFLGKICRCYIIKQVNSNYVKCNNTNEKDIKLNIVEKLKEQGVKPEIISKATGIPLEKIITY